MSNLGKKVLLYRTEISGKIPNVADIAVGELALNYNVDTPFIAFKDTNNELQKIGALTNSIGDSEFVTMSQKSITEAIDLNPRGGYIFIEKFDRENFQNALKLALESLEEGEDAIIDCTYFKGEHIITEGFQINNPVKLIFGGIDLTFDNPIDTNLFTFNCNNISIVGLNRNTDKTQTDNGATIFRMKNPDSSLNGYHIKSRGNKNILIEGITLKGLRTTMGRQYGNTQYPIDGVGGIYIEKAKPEVVEATNTCNNTRIENVLIAGSKAHGIYIDTPILSTFKNIRLSDCGGHGIFVNNGTSLMIENVYSSSANMAGFCIYGASYVSLNNCSSENSGIGFWIRSAFNVTLMSPGVEETRTYGTSPWRLSQPISGKYGLGLTTLSSDNTSVVEISDVNTEYSEYFIGYGILISGGKSINVFTPYVKTIGEKIVYEAYSGGTSLSTNVKFINIVGNNRSSFIMNPGFKEASDSLVPTNIKHEIGIGVDVEKLELIYDTNSTLLQGTLDSTTYVTDKDKRAPIYCKSTSCVIRSGKELITNYNASLPKSNSELANKEYVDSLINTIENKLSNNYISVVYPEDTGDKTFIPAISGQTLDEAVFAVETNVATLTQSVLENEEVTAAALTKHNESCGFDENANYIVNENATYISAATSLADADNLLNDAISNVYDELQQQIPSLDGYATETWVNNKNYATLNEVESKISELVDSAPDTLNTLNELAAALNDDANFATTVTNQIATKANSSDVYTKTESDGKYSLTSHTHDVYALKTALDTANNTIATLQTTISNLEAKIANIIVAVGLNTDGTFIVPTTAQTSGYTTASTSVMSAVVLMDNQIEENETVSAYALTDLNNRLTIVEDNINNS